MIHIFLCDDDSSYLEYLSEIVDRFFRQNNIEAGIKTFTDGEKLLEEPEMADIVFLDVEMPGKSGIEVGRRIKEKNPYALIFIVSFTEQYLDDAMDFQVFRYIEKSIFAGSNRAESERCVGGVSEYESQNHNYAEWRDDCLSGSRHCYD